MEDFNKALVSLGYPEGSLVAYKSHPSYYHRSKRIEGLLQWVCYNVKVENVKPREWEVKSMIAGVHKQQDEGLKEEYTMKRRRLLMLERQKEMVYAEMEKEKYRMEALVKEVSADDGANERIRAEMKECSVAMDQTLKELRACLRDLNVS
jgi:hypothetical protein